jgi:hypothetical protein
MCARTSGSIYSFHLLWFQITVTVLKPAAYLTHQEGELELKYSVQHLRKDGARPKQVPWPLGGILA